MEKNEDLGMQQENLKNEESSKDQENSKGQEGSKKANSFVEKLKEGGKVSALLLGAALLFIVGGPIGILLGILVILFAAKKPISKLTEKAYHSVMETVAKKKQVKKVKLKTQKVKKEEIGSSLEMGTDSLKEMKTRPDSISKIDVLPNERARLTSNGLQPNALKFQAFTKPNIELSELAKRLRNNAPSLVKNKMLPNLKNVRHSL
jgi:Na+-transporting methylmalonyl-CoA/oxaloacetate decarboxylase gamma subunit